VGPRGAPQAIDKGSRGRLGRLWGAPVGFSSSGNRVDGIRRSGPAAAASWRRGGHHRPLGPSAPGSAATGTGLAACGCRRHWSRRERGARRHWRSRRGVSAADAGQRFLGCCTPVIIVAPGGPADRSIDFKQKMKKKKKNNNNNNKKIEKVNV
jgi:hypothetical protein